MSDHDEKKSPIKVLHEAMQEVEIMFEDIPKNPSGYGMKLTSEEIEQAVNELNIADGKCEYCNFDYNDRHMGWCYHTRVNYVKGAKKHSDVYEYAQLAHALTYQGDAETDYYELRIVRHGLGKYKDGYSSVEVDHCPWCGELLREERK